MLRLVCLSVWTIAVGFGCKREPAPSSVVTSDKAPVVSNTPAAASSQPPIPPMSKKLGTAHTPGVGSEERKAVLDAARLLIHWDGQFVVHYLRVDGEWAFASLEQEDPTKKNRYESFDTICRAQGGKWKCLEALGGADLQQVIDDHGSAAKHFRRKYPGAPASLFGDK